MDDDADIGYGVIDVISVDLRNYDLSSSAPLLCVFSCEKHIFTLGESSTDKREGLSRCTLKAHEK